jgi:hypothetical protein
MNERVRTWSKARLLGWFVLSVFAVVGIGCGGRKATVSGSVSYRGKPLPSGSVTFFDANHQITGTATIADGKYSMSAVPAGPVKIAVSTPPVVVTDRRHPPKDVPGTQSSPVVPIPAHYSNPEQSGLSYEVKSGTQEHPIDLN